MVLGEGVEGLWLGYPYDADRVCAEMLSLIELTQRSIQKNQENTGVEKAQMLQEGEM